MIKSAKKSLYTITNDTTFHYFNRTALTVCINLCASQGPLQVITITHLQKPFVVKRQTNREQVHRENVSKRPERISQLLESEQLPGHIVTTN